MAHRCIGQKMIRTISLKEKLKAQPDLVNDSNWLQAEHVGRTTYRVFDVRGASFYAFSRIYAYAFFFFVS
jgi:hypothetical protein